jgi:DNA replication protein DnaC
VWDDFGAEKLSDYAARTLYTLLYEREGRSNVFTGNLSLGEIESRDPTGYTQRITSRIAGDARILRMTGPDRRFRHAAA